MGGLDGNGFVVIKPDVLLRGKLRDALSKLRELNLAFTAAKCRLFCPEFFHLCYWRSFAPELDNWSLNSLSTRTGPSVGLIIRKQNDLLPHQTQNIVALNKGSALQWKLKDTDLRKLMGSQNRNFNCIHAADDEQQSGIEAIEWFQDVQVFSHATSKQITEEEIVSMVNDHGYSPPQELYLEAIEALLMLRVIDAIWYLGGRRNPEEVVALRAFYVGWSIESRDLSKRGEPQRPRSVYIAKERELLLRINELFAFDNTSHHARKFCIMRLKVITESFAKFSPQLIEEMCRAFKVFTDCTEMSFLYTQLSYS